MRESTCFKMAANTEVDKFLSLLSSQIIDSYDCSQIVEDDSILVELLQEGTSALPVSSFLRNYIENNIDTCQIRLKNLLQPTTDTDLLVSTNTTSILDITQSVWTCSALSIDNVEESLHTICTNSDGRDVHELYRTLSFACISNQGTGLRKVLDYWAKYIVSNSSSIDTIVQSLHYISQCLISQHTIMECMKFVITLLSYYLHHNKEERDDTYSLVNIILSLLFSIHFHHSTLMREKDDSGRDGCYDDFLAALLSIYIELYLANEDNKDSLPNFPHLLKVLKTFTDDKDMIAIKALLQVVPPREETKPMLITAFKYYISSDVTVNAHRLNNPLDYLCKVCCISRMKRFTNTLREGGQKFDEIMMSRLSPSPQLSQWLWKNCPQTCKQLKLKRSWSCDRIHDYLTSNVTEEQEEVLLNLISNQGIEIPTTVNNSTSLHSVTDVHVSTNMETFNEKEKNNEERENKGDNDSKCVFYLDNEGTNDVIIQSDDDMVVEKKKEEGDIYMLDNEQIEKELPEIVNFDDSINKLQLLTEMDVKENHNDKDVTMETLKTTPTPSRKSRRKSLLKKLQKSLTPPTSRVMKFSPRVLRSVTRKKKMLTDKAL